MATQAQLDANRANAQKSTGPRTPEGRAAVRQNALKHGLTSMSPVAPGEDPAEFLQFLDYWTQSYLPIGPAEEEVLHTAVVASWRLRRIPAIEAGYYEMEHGGDQAVSPAARLAFAHYQCARQLSALSCQETRLHRTFEKSLRELERLQSRPERGSKSSLENQSQFPAQPEEAAGPGTLSDVAGRPEDASSSSAAAPSGGVPESLPENQTQLPTQADESTPSAASTQPAGPGISRRLPGSLTPPDRQAAEFIARVLARLPKTA